MDPTKRLIDLAAREVSTIRKWLHRDEVPSAPAVSLLLYQPLLSEGMQGCGQLLDVGHRPGGWTDNRICQSASSGETGNFLFGDVAARYKPTSSQIDQKARSAYRELNPEGLRIAQVALEKARYQGLPWLEADCPPEGAWIHHIALAPPTSDAAIPHPPTLGIAYMMTPSLPEDDVLWQLVHVAHQAARRALHERVAIMLDGDRKEVLQNLVAADPHAISCDQVHRLTMSWVFAHHWFFPHRPSAWEALCSFTGNEQAATDKYLQLGWSPPPLSPTPR